MAYEVSVVVATYNRMESLRCLLRDLEQQSYPVKCYEVVVVDDGSEKPVYGVLDVSSFRCHVRVYVQSNQGAAAARHQGIVRAEGRVVVLLDDDMRVGKDFLKAHMQRHTEDRVVVLGRMKSSGRLHKMPVFEKFHAHQLDIFDQKARHDVSCVTGVHLCTGNVSFSRKMYEQVGGFDTSLARSEDRELGVRFEKEGCVFVYEPLAESCHESDHDCADVWLRRAYLYGMYDTRIARKHGDVESANPWRFLWKVHPVSKMLLMGSVFFPQAGRALSGYVLGVSSLLDSLDHTSAGRSGATLCYGLQYFSGMRDEEGSLKEAVFSLLSYVDMRVRMYPGDASLRRFVHAVRKDYANIQKSRKKYKQQDVLLRDMPLDVVRKIGFQMMVAVRVMQFFYREGSVLQAQTVSRLIRHVYGADIHWEASIDPGVGLVHGMGVVVGPQAHVSSGCVLFQHVTLGEGIDVVTRKTGSPYLEENVHVGPGATLLGPVVIGKGSKIMAGAVVTESVPAYSVVKPASVRIEKKHRISDGNTDIRQDTRTRAYV